MRIIHMLLFLVTLFSATTLLIGMLFIPEERTVLRGVLMVLNLGFSFANFYFAVKSTE